MIKKALWTITYLFLIILTIHGALATEYGVNSGKWMSGYAYYDENLDGNVNDLANSTFHKTLYEATEMTVIRFDSNLDGVYYGVPNRHVESWEQDTLTLGSTNATCDSPYFWSCGVTTGATGVFTKETDAYQGLYSAGIENSGAGGEAQNYMQFNNLPYNTLLEFNVKVKTSDVINFYLQYRDNFTWAAYDQSAGTGSWETLDFTINLTTYISQGHRLFLEAGAGESLLWDEITILANGSLWQYYKKEENTNSANINQQKGQLEWAYNNSLTAILVLGYMPDAFTNVTPKCKNNPKYCGFSNSTEWQAFITDYLNEITNSGAYADNLKVEVWNEPCINLLDEVNDPYAIAQEYGRIYNATKTAVKASYPTMEVGGIGNYFYPTNACAKNNTHLYMQYSDSFDFISHHVYYDNNLSLAATSEKDYILALENTDFYITEYNVLSSNTKVNNTDLYIITISNFLRSMNLSDVNGVIFYDWASVYNYSQSSLYYEYPQLWSMVDQHDNLTRPIYDLFLDLPPSQPIRQPYWQLIDDFNTNYSSSHPRSGWFYGASYLGGSTTSNLTQMPASMCDGVAVDDYCGWLTNAGPQTYMCIYFNPRNASLINVSMNLYSTTNTGTNFGIGGYGNKVLKYTQSWSSNLLYPYNGTYGDLIGNFGTPHNLVAEIDNNREKVSYYLDGVRTVYDYNYRPPYYYGNLTQLCIGIQNVVSSKHISIDDIYFTDFGSSFGVDWSDYTTMDSINYIDDEGITYTSYAYCDESSSANIDVYIDSDLYSTQSVTCNNTYTSNSGTIIASDSGAHWLKVYFNESGTSTLIGDFNATYDLNPPEITLNITAVTELGGGTNLNISMICTDDINTTLLYNYSLNGNLIWLANQANNTEQRNITQGIDGINTLFGTCSDLFYSTSDEIDYTLYAKVLALIDEKTGLAFDVSNLSGVKVYFDDNSSYFDFKSAGVSSINYTSGQPDKLRFELEYITGDIITRYVGLGVWNTTPLRVCANKEGVVHYEQLILSAVQRRAILVNPFSNCTVGADYTRFAYQDSYVLKAFTINAMYYLYIYDTDGQKITLANIDGSIASYINIDVLEFNREGVDISILGNVISVEQIGSSEIMIYYENLKANSVSSHMTITRMDTGSTLYSGIETSTPDDYTVMYDWASLSNISNKTLFKVEVCNYDVDNNEECKSRYFTPSGSSGILQNGFAVIFAVILMLSGLFFTRTNTTFSWFGIMICIAAIAVLAYAVGGVWYITFMQALCVIELVFIVIVLTQQNQNTIT